MKKQTDSIEKDSSCGGMEAPGYKAKGGPWDVAG